MTITEKKLDIFFKLIENQFVHGGKKYSSNHPTKEATDILCEKHGYRGLFWTINKYIFRFRNFHAEKDLLKISCYLFLIWIKRGFFVLDEGINDPIISTNINLKIQNYDKFKKFIKKENRTFLNSTKLFIEKEKAETYLNFVEGILQSWSEPKKQWKDISLLDIDAIFTNIFYIWQFEFAELEEHKEDIKNDNKKKN